MKIESLLFSLERYRTDLSKLNSLDNKGVHNFAIGTLDAYFYLFDMMKHKNPPIMYCDSILFLPNKQGKYKSFVYKEPENSTPILEKLIKLGPIYSIDKLEGLAGGAKFAEVAYDLAEVMNPASYSNAKKRHQRLTYPIKQLEKNNVVVEPLSESNYKSVEILHEKWVEHKYSDPKLFKMMFPNKRYIYCCRKALDSPSRYRTYVFMQDGVAIAARVLTIQDNRAFDLANFGNTWDCFSNLMNYADTYVLKDLFENGFTDFNCGAALNKKLRAFKEHYPCHDVISYMYSPGAKK